MRVEISKHHLSLSTRLARELNRQASAFNSKSYSKIEDIESALLRRDVSVEQKKRLLMAKLHDAIVKAFAVNKKNFSKKSLNPLKNRLHNARRLIIKLRGINYYLETTFCRSLKLSKIKTTGKSFTGRQALPNSELAALEYTAYRLIGEAVVLDKRLLKEYADKEKSIVSRENIEVKDLSLILRKESELLEHLEAKLPPPKEISAALVKEPMFTHWASRVFALLLWLEQAYENESAIFSKLKRSKAFKIKISKKITSLIKEQSKLVGIMQEKAASMKSLRPADGFKSELHNLTTTINL